MFKQRLDMIFWNKAGAPSEYDKSRFSYEKRDLFVVHVTGSPY